MKASAVGCVWLVALVSFALPAPGGLQSKELMKEQAQEMLTSGDCQRMVEGLRLFKKADGGNPLHKHAADVFLSCESPRTKALSLVIGMDSEEDLAAGEQELLEGSMASKSPTLRGAATFLLARRGGLSRDELRQAIQVADEKEELLLLCGAVRREGDHARCDQLRASFEERVQQLLGCEGDEIVVLKMQILGRLFPREALKMLEDLARSDLRPRPDNISLIRDAWSRSAVSQTLNDSLSSLGEVSPLEVEQIEFLRLAAPSALSVLQRALHVEDLEVRLAAIQANEAMGSAAMDLAKALEEIALDSQDPARSEAAMALTLVAPPRGEQVAMKVKPEDPALSLALKKRLLEHRLD